MVLEGRQQPAQHPPTNPGRPEAQNTDLEEQECLPGCKLCWQIWAYIRGGATQEKSHPLCNDVMMSSIWMKEWSVCVYMSLSPKRVPRFILWHCSWGGVQTKGAWVIRPPPTEDPLTQTAQWHQAKQQAAKNSFMHLNTHQALLRLHPSYFHNCWRHLKLRPSQHNLPGSIWTGLFMWNVFHKQFIYVCFRKLKKISRCHIQMASLQNLSLFVNLGLRKVLNNFNKVEV